MSEGSAMVTNNSKSHVNLTISKGKKNGILNSTIIAP